MIFVSRLGSHRRRLLLPRTPAQCPSRLRFSTISRRQRFPATVAYDLTRFCRSRRAAHPLVLPTAAPERCGAPCPCALTGGFGSAASRLAHADFLLPAPVPVERQRQRPPPLDLCGAPPARAAHNRVAAHSARPRVPERTPALGDHPRRLLDPVHRFHLRAQFGHRVISAFRFRADRRPLHVMPPWIGSRAPDLWAGASRCARRVSVRRGSGYANLSSGRGFAPRIAPGTCRHEPLSPN